MATFTLLPPNEQPPVRMKGAPLGSFGSNGNGNLYIKTGNSALTANSFNGVRIASTIRSQLGVVGSFDDMDVLKPGTVITITV